MKPLLSLLLPLLYVPSVLSCISTTSASNALDLSASKSDGAKISFLLNDYNVTSKYCYEECCRMNTKDHCNVATFFTKEPANETDIIGADLLGNCTLISCAPLSSCRFIASKIPCYSIILNSTGFEADSNTDSDSDGSISDFMSELLKTIGKERASKAPVNVTANLTTVGSTTESHSVSTNADVDYMSSLNYSNGLSELGLSGTKPRKGVQNNPNGVTSQKKSKKVLSGSKPRKGVHQSPLTTQVAASVNSTQGSVDNRSSVVTESSVWNSQSVKSSLVTSPVIESKTQTEALTPENDFLNFTDEIKKDRHHTVKKIMSDSSTMSTGRWAVDGSTSATTASTNVGTKQSSTAAAKTTKPISPTPSARVKVVSTPAVTVQTHIASPIEHSQSTDDPKVAASGESSSKSSAGDSTSIHLVIALVFGILLLVTVVGLIGRAFHESWQRRHYRRMDFLVDGMYDN